MGPDLMSKEGHALTLELITTQRKLVGVADMGEAEGGGLRARNAPVLRHNALDLILIFSPTVPAATRLRGVARGCDGGLSEEPAAGNDQPLH
jgi:hypothetical protein